jgi:hypothetical protein
MPYNLEQIKKEYPWAYAENQNMILGDDIDAIMSACFLHHHFGWKIKGFYVKYNKLFIEKDIEDIKTCIFVDLDIAQNEFKSIGHHILQINLDDSLNKIGHKNSLNPNILRGKTMQTFRTKYPLGTIHFLMWIHQKNIPIDNINKNILWIPDSSWINGQSHRFRQNVLEWVNYLNLTTFIDTTYNIDSLAFETIIQNKIYPSIINTGFSQGYGQVRSRHLNLTGFQCQFINPIIDKIKLEKLINLICNIFEWNIPSLPEDYNITTGERKSSNIEEECYQKGLAPFIEEKNIFSYVIPNYRRINYTVF